MTQVYLTGGAAPVNNRALSPITPTWQYLFYVDFQGHVSDPDIATAVEEMRKECLFLRVLGSYPEAS